MGNILLGKDITVVNISGGFENLFGNLKTTADELMQSFLSMNAIALNLEQTFGDLSNTICDVDDALRSEFINDVMVAGQEANTLAGTMQNLNSQFEAFLQTYIQSGFLQQIGQMLAMTGMEIMQLVQVIGTELIPAVMILASSGGGTSAATGANSSNPILDIMSGANTGYDFFKNIKGIAGGVEGEGVAGGLGELAGPIGMVITALISFGTYLSTLRGKYPKDFFIPDILNKGGGQQGAFGGLWSFGGMTSTQNNHAAEEERRKIEDQNISNKATMQGKGWGEYSGDLWSGAWYNITGQSDKQEERLKREYKEKKEAILVSDPRIPDEDKVKLYNTYEGKKTTDPPEWYTTLTKEKLAGEINDEKGILAGMLAPQYHGFGGLQNYQKEVDDPDVVAKRIMIKDEELQLQKLNEKENASKKSTSPISSPQSNPFFNYFNPASSSNPSRHGYASPSSQFPITGTGTQAPSKVFNIHVEFHDTYNDIKDSLKNIHDQIVEVLTNAVSDARIGAMH